jgi:hypothetical protein
MFDVTGEHLRVLRPHDPLPASASQLWAERVNPVWWQTHTPVGDWRTDDRRTWRTADGHWLAGAARSVYQRHVFMAVWHDDTYLGFQNDIGWQPAMARSHTHHSQ